MQLSTRRMSLPSARVSLTCLPRLCPAPALRPRKRNGRGTEAGPVGAAPGPGAGCREPLQPQRRCPLQLRRTSRLFCRSCAQNALPIASCARLDGMRCELRCWAQRRSLFLAVGVQKRAQADTQQRSRRAPALCARHLKAFSKRRCTAVKNHTRLDTRVADFKFSHKAPRLARTAREAADARSNATYKRVQSRTQETAQVLPKRKTRTLPPCSVGAAEARPFARLSTANLPRRRAPLLQRRELRPAPGDRVLEIQQAVREGDRPEGARRHEREDLLREALAVVVVASRRHCCGRGGSCGAAVVAVGAGRVVAGCGLELRVQGGWEPRNGGRRW